MLCDKYIHVATLRTGKKNMLNLLYNLRTMLLTMFVAHRNMRQSHIFSLPLSLSTSVTRSLKTVHRMQCQNQQTSFQKIKIKYTSQYIPK